MNSGIVIIGAGQAGVQLADSLRNASVDVPITLIADEVHHPYQRPPLSKSLWETDMGTSAIPLRSLEFFNERDINLVAGVCATQIDRDQKRVHLDNGELVPYDALVLATGARPRTIPLSGSDLAGVHQLRTIDDAMALQDALRSAASVVVIGGGFIGLEIAASATQNGLEVTVIEMQARILERALTPAASQNLYDTHTQAGTNILLSTTTTEILPGDDGRVGIVVTGDSQRIQADLVVLGVGAVPNVELAKEAGLEVCNGIVVDSTLRTTDPAIWAIGDCAYFPSHYTGANARLESVQNATDQGRIAAKNIAATLSHGTSEDYTAVPWFWSNQGDVRLQIAGIGNAAEADVVVRDYGDGKVSFFAYENDKLTVVESINAAGDHTAARRLIAAGGTLDPQLAADPAVSLKDVVNATMART